MSLPSKDPAPASSTLLSNLVGGFGVASTNANSTTSNEGTNTFTIEMAPSFLNVETLNSDNTTYTPEQLSIIAKELNLPTPTEVGEPSDLATDLTQTNLSTDAAYQMFSDTSKALYDPLNYSFDNLANQGPLTMYSNAVNSLTGNLETLAGNATGMVDKANALYGTLTDTASSAVSAVTDIVGNKVPGAINDLMSVPEKLDALVGQAQSLNPLNFFEKFKTLDGLLDAGANIANSIGKNLQQLGNDFGAVLNQDWDKLSFPKVNISRISSLLDTESFSKLGTGVLNFAGNFKLPIGLSLNQITELPKLLNQQQGLLSALQNPGETLTNAAQNIAQGAVGTVTGIAQSAVGTVQGVVQGAAGAVQGTISSVNSLLSNVNSGITNIMSSVSSLSNLRNIANSLVGGLASKINLDPDQTRSANKAALELLKNPTIARLEKTVTGDRTNSTS